jgi:hypothetical protein
VKKVEVSFITALESTMEWSGMEWNGMEWSGMEWKLSLIIGCTCFDIIKYLFSVVEVCEL